MYTTRLTVACHSVHMPTAGGTKAPPPPHLFRIDMATIIKYIVNTHGCLTVSCLENQVIECLLYGLHCLMKSGVILNAVLSTSFGIHEGSHKLEALFEVLLVVGMSSQCLFSDCCSWSSGVTKTSSWLISAFHPSLQPHCFYSPDFFSSFHAILYTGRLL